jgi:hypothetical protein
LLTVATLLSSTNNVTYANSGLKDPTLEELFETVDRKDPREFLDNALEQSEFEQYYMRKNRGKTPSLDRNVWFGNSDINKDTYLSLEELTAHEEMITHFTTTTTE